MVLFKSDLDAGQTHQSTSQVNVPQNQKALRSGPLGQETDPAEIRIEEQVRIRRISGQSHLLESTFIFE